MVKERGEIWCMKQRMEFTWLNPKGFVDTQTSKYSYSGSTKGRDILMDRVFVWSGLLLLINLILNKSHNDLIFITGVLIPPARSSYCHSLIPWSQQRVTANLAPS